MSDYLHSLSIAVIDPRQTILAALIRSAPDNQGPDGREKTATWRAYKAAVIAVCYAIEESAQPDELWSAGISIKELTPQHRIGEHLSATRRYFGLIP